MNRGQTRTNQTQPALDGDGAVLADWLAHWCVRVEWATPTACSASQLREAVDEAVAASPAGDGVAWWDGVGLEVVAQVVLSSLPKRALAAVRRGDQQAQDAVEAAILLCLWSAHRLTAQQWWSRVLTAVDELRATSAALDQLPADPLASQPRPPLDHARNVYDVHSEM